MNKWNEMMIKNRIEPSFIELAAAAAGFLDYDYKSFYLNSNFYLNILYIIVICIIKLN